MKSNGRLNFIGGCCAHVAGLVALIPNGLKVRVLQESFLLNRGGNDSFLRGGKIKRIGLSIDGLMDIADFFFGLE